MSNHVSVRNYAQSLSERKSPTTFFAQSLKKRVLKTLESLQFGELALTDGEQNWQFSGSRYLSLKADIEVLDEQFYPYLAFGGSVGAGEAYINGYWRSNNLTEVIRLFAVNQSVTDSVEGGLARFTAPLKRTFHWLNKNTQSGSKKNIVAHYDLGNDFFKAFLDPTMMYSAGIFYSNDESMQQASINKLERICQRLRLNQHDSVIEIGTGWGSFAIYAAKNYGCHITTTTISEEQHQYAKQRIIEEGLSDKITLLKQDYRELNGKFDKLVSIEMIEAVGHHYFDTFFAKCSSLLKDHGEMLLQAITIADQRFESAKKDVDFIKRYIFPGCCIPSIDAISDSLRKSGNMRILNLEDIGVHYAKTLNAWRKKFFENIEQVKSLGYSDAFIRLWEFYLCYCEGGFEERVISDIQLHTIKPLARVPEKLALLEQ